MRANKEFTFENTAKDRPSVWNRLSDWWKSFRMQSPTRTETAKRLIQVWDQRLMCYRHVDLNNPEDPLWMAAYHVHAVRKGSQTGPAF